MNVETLDLTKLSFEEIKTLHARVVDQYNVLVRNQRFQAMSKFRIGQKVSFVTRDRGTVVGVLTKMNKKTCTVTPATGGTWRVSPNLLRSA